ncbi:MAG: glycosyltransferase family 4 protein [Zoogloea sp.]|nr:glycosyltransferase family 4 protein [Zoogloea sp.]
MRRPRLRILTWHVHGNYLYYLSQVPHDFYLPFDARRGAGYAGRCGSLPWGDNMHELPAGQLRQTEFDCLLFQSPGPYLRDQYSLLSAAQRRLPRIYLEHDPPQEHPCNTCHPVDDPSMLLVHVTHFNRLMWDSRRTPTRVIEHGVLLPPAAAGYDGSLARGIAVVNHLERRGRRLGADVFAAAREAVPLDLVGMDSERSGGLGEIDNLALPDFMARYRFYFHPVRWTSLGLSAIEAMMVGLPIVGLASTELACVIDNGRSGFVDTNPARLIEGMRRLLDAPDEARAMGQAARRDAEARFGIRRFVDDWLAVLDEVTQ